MNCFFGHRWGKWERVKGNPMKTDGGVVYRHQAQQRICTRCNFTDFSWLNICEYEEPDEPDLSSASATTLENNK